jgi:ABC-type multidrug transport system ATPase subunit
LLSLVAGTTSPRSGRVRVLDGEPTEARIRPQIGYVPLQAILPDAMRVTEVLATASAIRREPGQPPADRLRALGVEGLASRLVSSLSREEARAVALAEAATSSRVRVLLVEEPFVSMDPRAATRLRQVLQEKALGGAAVVVATASELADDHTFLRDGAVMAQATSWGATAALPPNGVRLHIFSSEARALAAALACEGGVEAVVRRDASVLVRGRDATELARAAARAIVTSGAGVTEMGFDPPAPEEARAAAAALNGEGKAP